MNDTRRGQIKKILQNLRAAAQQLEAVRAAESTAQANTPANFQKNACENEANALTLIEGAQRDLDEIIYCLECVECFGRT